MIKFSKFLLAGLCFFITKVNFLFASAIPAEDLFRWPDTYAVNFNPSTRYIAKYYLKNEKYNVIEIQDVKTNRKADAFSLKVTKNSNIKAFFWIDEDTLYISYKINKDESKRIFIDIDYDAFQNSKNNITTKRTIRSSGSLLNPLIYENNTVLVKKNVDNEIFIYKTTTEKFANDLFEKADQFTNTLSGSIGYYTNNQGQIKVAIKNEDDKLEVWYLKNRDSKWVKLFDLGEFQYEFIPIAVLNNSTMLVLTNKDTDKVSLVRYNYLTKKFGDIVYQHEKYDLIDASVIEDTKELLSVSYYDHGYLRTDYFPEKKLNIDRLIKNHFADKNYFVTSKREGSSKLIIFVYSELDPGSYYWFDPKINSLVKIAASHTFLDKYKFSKTHSFSVTTKEGIEIEALLTKPSVGNSVLLVQPHGGPVGVRDVNGFNSSNQFYASRGYSILNLNFRGSSGYGKKFLREGKGQFGKKIEEDISLVVNNVLSKYDFDSICSIGSSYGGYSAIFLLANNPDLYKCAVAAYGVYDLPLLFNSSNTKMNDKHLRAVTNTVGKYSEKLKDYSPVYFAEKIKGPVLLIAGEDDPITGLEQSNRMKYRLKQLNKDVDTLFYTKTGHGHKSLAWERHEHIATENFIRNKLKLDNLHLFNKEILGKEAMILADSYTFDDKVKNSEKKAFSYYKVAAQNNQPRGLFNYADFFMDGDIVEKDVNKALGLYKKSAKLGYANANYILGKIYREGKIIKKNLALSLKYFKKAKEQGSVKAGLEIELANCMGWVPSENFDNCIAYIDNLFKDSVNIAMSILQDMLFNSNLSVNETNKIINLLADNNYLNLSRSEFRVENVGLFGTSRTSFVYKHKETDKNLKVTGWETIGIQYSLKNKSENIDKNSPRIFKITWEHPNIAGNTNEEIKTKTEHLYWSEPNKIHNLFFNFNEHRKKKNGEWRLKIQTLNGESVFSESWNLDFKNGNK